MFHYTTGLHLSENKTIDTKQLPIIIERQEEAVNGIDYEEEKKKLSGDSLSLNQTQEKRMIQSWNGGAGAVPANRGTFMPRRWNGSTWRDRLQRSQDTYPQDEAANTSMTTWNSLEVKMSAFI